jgi:hypothetical protein
VPEVLRYFEASIWGALLAQMTGGGLLDLTTHQPGTAARAWARWGQALLLMLALAAAAMPALAHHSFAVFFDTDNQLAKVTGVVKEFRFTNPHGIVTLAVHEANQEVIWHAETNSPSFLRRLGWSPDSLHVGETITVEGWRARDGSRYMRLRSATRANGEPIGTAPTPTKEQ